MENSELDLLEHFHAEKETAESLAIEADMKQEVGECVYPDLIPQLARFETALLRFLEKNKGNSEFVVMANKCWPAFQTSFGFVPCYVNSRLASQGIPVACEVDIYGAVSEYMAQLASEKPATILDFNNTVPPNLFSNVDEMEAFNGRDLFMGFHCGNTPSCHVMNPKMKYQYVMHRLLESDSPPRISRGTLEGRIKPGEMTLFRLQGTSDARLTSYVAEGRILDVDPHSFGSIGVMGVHGLSRFYRNVLISKAFPHHAAIAFSHCGHFLFEAVRLITGIRPEVPLPSGHFYKNENPFEVK